MPPDQGLFSGHQSPQPLHSQSARPAGCGVGRARRCCSARAGVAREGGGQSRRNAPEPQVSGGLCSPCHLGTAHTDAAWAPGARHLRARRQPPPRRRRQEGSTSGLRGGAPAGLARSPDAAFLSQFPKVKLERATADLLWATQYLRCYTLTSPGCAAFSGCSAVESNAVKGEVLDSGQAFPGPPGPEGVGS